MCTSSSQGSPREKYGNQTVSTSATDDPANAASSSSSGVASVSELKETGNCLLKEGKPKAAVNAYTGALQSAVLEQLDDQQKAVLLSNRSLAYVKAHLNAKVSLKRQCDRVPAWLLSPLQNLDCHEARNILI